MYAATAFLYLPERGDSCAVSDEGTGSFVEDWDGWVLGVGGVDRVSLSDEERLSLIRE